MRSSITTATREPYPQENEKWQYQNFGIHEKTHCLFSQLAQDPKTPILKVRITEDSDGIWWAWWDNKDNEFQHIYPKRFLVEMCSPYGFIPEEKRGDGRILPVTIEEED
jgi:hypothetical protein